MQMVRKLSQQHKQTDLIKEFFSRQNNSQSPTRTFHKQSTVQNSNITQSEAPALRKMRESVYDSNERLVPFMKNQAPYMTAFNALESQAMQSSREATLSTAEHYNYSSSAVTQQ